MRTRGEDQEKEKTRKPVPEMAALYRKEKLGKGSKVYGLKRFRVGDLGRRAERSHRH